MVFELLCRERWAVRPLNDAGHPTTKKDLVKPYVHKKVIKHPDYDSQEEAVVEVVRRLEKKKAQLEAKLEISDNPTLRNELEYVVRLLSLPYE